jgi:hypothetical protein
MNPNWAEENLKTIRTLMERSALYRRALAPIMIFVGVIGIAGGILGRCLQIDSTRGFVFFWSGVAAVALAGAFLLVRRQALKDSEPFWSPPTRRVTQAMTPTFYVGALASAVMVFSGDTSSPKMIFIIVWCWAFGCGIHAAGFFMPRGIRWFGWIFIVFGGLLLLAALNPKMASLFMLNAPHWLMGAIFGGLHLAYGIYLYFTEKKNPVV